jgi:hypothetical protein
MIRGLWGTAAGLLMFLSLLFYLLGVAFGYLEGGKGWRGWPLLLLMEAPFHLVSVGLLLVPVWWGQQAIRTCYALTNRRAIGLSCAWYGALRVCSYAPGDLTRMQRATAGLTAAARATLFSAAVPWSEQLRTAAWRRAPITMVSWGLIRSAVWKSWCARRCWTGVTSHDD